MALKSTMMELGTRAPDFTLTDVTTNEAVRLEGSPAVATVVAFICNHCPYVVHIITEFVRFATEYQKKGVRFIAISSNDPVTYPDDAPDNMKAFASKYAFPFPYVFDSSQDVARAYDAACTPDLYVFDATLHCVYRGRFDDSTPGNGKPVTGSDLRDALDSICNGQPVSREQYPSIGCSIKWKQNT